MEKVLIIAYKFPPNIETAANRIYSWVKYLHEFGIKPIVITRNWDFEQEQDLILNSYKPNPKGTEIIYKDLGTYEVYYLPYFGNSRTNFYYKNRNSGLNRFIYKALSLRDKLFEANSFYKFSDFNFFVEWTEQFVRQNNDIKRVVISSLPHQLFYIGYKLKMQFGVKWIADYRDPWNTDQVGLSDYIKPNSKIHNYLRNQSIKNEKKWCGSAECITSVSDYLTKTIAEFVNVQNCCTIYNGYFEEDLKLVSNESTADSSHFNIIYNGSLYDFQKIEMFLNTTKKIILENKFPVVIKIHFVGLGFNERQVKRVRNIMCGFESNYEIYNRIPKKQYMELQNMAQLLLLICPNNFIKGIATSKIFDYIISRKLVFVAPSDKDVVEKILLETGQGIFANTDSEIYDLLNQLLSQYVKNDGIIDFKYNEEKVQQYSRRAQTQILAERLYNL